MSRSTRAAGFSLLAFLAASAPAFADPPDEAAAIAYDGFAAHYDDLADKAVGQDPDAVAAIKQHYRDMAAEYRRKAAAFRAGTAPASPPSNDAPPKFYGTDLKNEFNVETAVASTHGDVIRAYLDPVAGRTLPKNVADAIQAYLAAHPDARTRYGPPAEPPAPPPNAPAAPPPSAGSDAGGSPDTLRGSPSYAAADAAATQAEGGGASGAGGAGSLSADKGIGAAGGKLGGAMGAMKERLGSTSEIAGAGAAAGVNGAARGPAGQAARPAQTAAGSERAVPYDALNQRTAGEIRAQVSPERRSELLSDFKTDPANIKFKDLAPVMYAGGSLAHDGGLETFGFTRRCSPPDDCNEFAQYPYAPGQLARAETLNKMPLASEEKALKSATKAEKTAEKPKSSERSKIAALWAAIGDRIARARAASSGSASAPHRSIGGSLSSLLARLSGRSGRAGGDQDLAVAARYAAAVSAGSPGSPRAGTSAAPAAGLSGADIKQGLEADSPPAPRGEGSRALGLGLAAVAAAALAAMLFWWRKRRENA